jgi:hypothetical protein
MYPGRDRRSTAGAAAARWPPGRDPGGDQLGGESAPRVPFGHDRFVRSVADQLKEEDRARMAALSPAQRVTLSLRLAETAARVLCAAQGLERDEAVKLPRAIRHRGRRASGSASG